MAEAQAQCLLTTVLQEVTMLLTLTVIMLYLVVMLHPQRALVHTAYKPVMLSSTAKRMKGLALLSSAL